MSEATGAEPPSGRQKNRSDSARQSQDHSGYSDESYEPKLEEGADGVFAPIKPATAGEDEQRHEPMEKLRSTTSRSIERSWSLNDGYSCNPDYEETDEGTDRQDIDFVVGWDEGDPMNPRNFPTLRRWSIVLICASGSLCA
ncbi:resistance protein [Aspergillus sclerotialis]|uniref:Resistance protein n=1 Tax=Aspergillus sclerotialis TaxID=2070753 RepID=A0A3A2ZSC7_9EURO|nr:resistance protein [Aspergillus sclerotialis]